MRKEGERMVEGRGLIILRKGCYLSRAAGSMEERDKIYFGWSVLRWLKMVRMGDGERGEGYLTNVASLLKLPQGQMGRVDTGDKQNTG